MKTNKHLNDDARYEGQWAALWITVLVIALAATLPWAAEVDRKTLKDRNHVRSYKGLPPIRE